MTAAKILVIVGSPRRQNSYKVVKKLEEELAHLGQYDFEYLFLGESDLRLCKGCHNCLFRGEDLCPLTDDSKGIRSKMLGSDGIILVSPVYVINVTGLMKNFIDRMCFLCHRPGLFNQDFMVVSTVGAIGLKKTLTYMKQVAEVWGAKSITTLGVKTPPKEEIFTDKNTRLIRKAADRYHHNFARQFRPSFNHVMQFEMQKAVFTQKSAKKITPADYQHYMRLKDKHFNIPVRINPIKSMVAKLMRLVLIR
ncbi:MAG: flavodoxin family protein [Nanobdellota archaeon]